MDVISKVITLSFSRSVPATRTIVLSVCLCHHSLLQREIESRESRYGYTVITCEQTFDHPHTNTQWVLINSEEEHFASSGFLVFQFPFEVDCGVTDRHLQLSYISQGQNKRSVELLPWK